MKKIVINACYGGFSLSDAATKRYYALKNDGAELYAYEAVPNTGLNRYNRVDDTSSMFVTHLKHDYGPVIKNIREVPSEDYFYHRDSERDDPVLIQVIEEMGSEAASGQCAELEIVEIPDDVEWHIEEYDGYEHVAEDHRTWG